MPGARRQHGRARLVALGVVATVLATSTVAVGAAPNPNRWTARTVLTPVVTGLLSVSCPTAAACVAVGGALDAGSFGGTGLVLRSTDGGGRWRPEPLPLGTPDLETVTCPTASTCLAAADTVLGSEVLTSVDGGAHWSASPSATLFGSGAVDLSCASATYCMGVGNALFGASVIASADAGQTWTSVAPFVLGDAVVGAGVACPAVDTCSVVGTRVTQKGLGGVFFTTTDGGITWSAATLPVGVMELDAIACPAVGDCLVAGRVGTSDAILTTTDAGATWTQRTIPDAQDAGLTAITCTSSSDCLAAGSQTGGVGEVVSTSDGGATWSQVPSPSARDNFTGIACPQGGAGCLLVGAIHGSPAEFSLRGGTLRGALLPDDRGVGGVVDLTCATSTHCVLEAGAAGSHDGQLLHTTDDGRRWTRAGIPAGDVLREASCPTSTTCVGAGVRDPDAAGVLLVSHNGGASWQQRGTLPYPLEAVACASTAVCVAGGADELYRTTDGGRTWHDDLPHGASWLVRALACGSPSTCVLTVLSPSGTLLVLRSDDAGRRWKLSLRTKGLDVGSLACLDATTCLGAASPTGGQVVLVGSTSRALATPEATEGAEVLITHDGGRRWGYATVPPTATGLSSLSCLGRGLCLATGPTSDSAFALRSTNGGRTWVFTAAPRGTDELDLVTCRGGACWSVGTTPIGATMLAQRR